MEMRKGITPVVAIILLLLLTVAFIGFASGFFQRVFTTSATATQTETERIAGSTERTFRIENAAVRTITIRNTGSQTITQAELQTYVGGVAFTPCSGAGPPGFPALGIPQGQVGTCSWTAAQGAVCTGSVVRVVGSSIEDSVTCD